MRGVGIACTVYDHDDVVISCVFPEESRREEDGREGDDRQQTTRSSSRPHEGLATETKSFRLLSVITSTGSPLLTFSLSFRLGRRHTNCSWAARCRRLRTREVPSASGLPPKDTHPPVEAGQLQPATRARVRTRLFLRYYRSCPVSVCSV